ncbi:MAG TPA: helix-turn-helix domain-containing protein [Armatimonadota bacterium]|jgi:predicted transcriptional regulator
MSGRAITFSGARAVAAAKALGSEARAALLDHLAQGPHTVSQLAAALGIAQPAATQHVRLLAEAGLLTISSGTGERGATKICQRTYDEIHLCLTPLPTVPVAEQTVLSLPVGAFSRCEAHPTCGLASTEALIGFIDDPRAFYLAERVQAGILWFGWGFVEYAFANPLLGGQSVERLDFSAELCSEAPDFAQDYPSDIAFTINGIPVGQWTCPGDMGDRRGALNPAWWAMGTQYGFLKTVSVRDEGTFIDGTRVSAITPRELLGVTRPAISIQISVAESARYRGGLTLFGRGFGNYPTDPTLTITTRPRE